MGALLPSRSAGLTSLKDFDSGHTKYNASVQLATDIGDTVKRIDGTEVPLLAPWRKANASADASNANESPAAKPAPAAAKAKVKPKAKPKADAPVTKNKSSEKQLDNAVPAGTKPDLLSEARAGGADDLKLIKGVGPKLESVLNGIGVYHYDQIATWNEDEVSWADQNLPGFKGRVSRDNWVTQAQALARGEDTEFSQRAKKDDIYKE